MKEITVDEIISILEKAGPSSEHSRDKVTEYHGNIKNMMQAAELWAKSHGVSSASKEDTFVAYASAVDLGYRIKEVELEMK